MNKLNFMLGMGMVCAMAASAASAQTSPYTGSTPPEEGSAVFYLYQVETNRWVQENRAKGGTWTTRAELGNVGLDIIVEKVEGGYRLNPRLNGNHSINGNNLWMDTGDKATVWNFEPIEGADGVSNAFRIVATEGPGDGYPHYLGVGGDNLLSTNDKNKTWQLVSPADRTAYMIANAGTDKADATWMIPWQDFGRNNEREKMWTLKHANDGSGVAVGGIQRNAVREAWNNARGYVHYTTLTDLPNGTYEVRVQGYNRENWDDNIAWKKYTSGVHPLNASYFAGASSKELMHIADDHFTGDAKPSDHDWLKITQVGRWIPNSLDAASYIFDTGRYYNDWITAIVTDGTLTLGIMKPHGSTRDWLVYDNFEMRYVSDSTDGADAAFYSYMEQVGASFENIMSRYPYTNQAIMAAMENAGMADDANKLRLAELDFICAHGVYVESNIDNFHAVYALAQQENIYDVEEHMSAFHNAADNAGISNALRDLRYARRRAAAERQEDIFSGQTPAAGDFYLYNVGQKQFLCGGSDWGAHAALGMPGVLLTLEATETADAFVIDTHLYNGDNNHYLNDFGYMDTPTREAWKFVPAEGTEGVFYVVQNKNTSQYLAWNPYAPTDKGGNDETTVGARETDMEGNPDAMWKLITADQRLALMEQAGANNPVDVSFLIKSPNFSNREKAGEVWSMTNASVWDTQGNHYDFAPESWNQPDCDVYQLIEGLPKGVYAIEAQGYYRNGRHANQPDDEIVSYAMLYAAEQQHGEENDTPSMRAIGDASSAEKAFPNVLSEDGMAPGEGHDTLDGEGNFYHVPDAVNQGTDFFKLGLYKNMVAIHKYDDTTPLKIGVKKEKRDREEDWMVFDNFRLKYYGTETTGVDNVSSDTTANAEADADAPTYNLQGIRVTDTAMPGIYIRNGRKFVVK